MELQFAYQAMTVIQKLDPDLTEEQMGYMQYWVQMLYKNLAI